MEICFLSHHEGPKCNMAVFKTIKSQKFVKSRRFAKASWQPLSTMPLLKNKIVSIQALTSLTYSLEGFCLKT